MIKQLLLSSLAGVFVTLLFAATPITNAACQGYCAERKIIKGCELSYAGCTIHYDKNDKPYDADCFYVGVCEGPLFEAPPAN